MPSKWKAPVKSNWNWMQGQQDAAKAKAEAEKEPDTCDLCGKKIEKDDTYYIGTTHELETMLVWAYTCTGSNCVKWLITKKKLVKGRKS